jgi:acetoin:2,6-dichlorophenolindophenol oxidoreductase subunit alpha
VLFVCENNGYGEYAPIADVAAGASLTGRGTVFDIPSPMIDGMDVVAVHDAAVAAVARARSGGGPSFLVCNTWRYGGHHAGDKQGYKDREEVAAWEAKDPILRLARELTQAGIADQTALDDIARSIDVEVKTAVDFAKASPEPDVADLRSRVFA